MNFVEDLRRCFSYDPDTGVITYKRRRKYTKVKPGEKAGCKMTMLSHNGSKRIYIRFRGKRYAGARIAWLITHGEIKPGYVIDHINGDTLDDRLCNLRAVTPEENNKNRKINTKNTSGVVGVSYKRNKKIWQAEIWDAGKRVYLGIYKTKEEASAARRAAEKILGYTVRYDGQVSP